jgi:filamentous hemagglutinin family protein
MKLTFRQVGNALPVWSAAYGSWWLLCGSAVEANPVGMTVGSGSASAVGQGPVLTVTASDRAFLTWQSFNIAPGEKTVFNQPSASSIVWNQILDSNPSRIFGSIQANGIVVLANQQGFWFGPDSVVKAASFVATTAAGPGQGFFNGGPWSLEVPPPAASIVNYGQMSVASGGSLFLVAEKVENHGVLTAPDGTLGLYAGKEVWISERPDGRGLSAKVTLPEGAVDNFGRLVADAGSIALRAQVVNQEGIVQADSIREVNGVVEIYASSEVHLGADSVTSAQGTGATPSPGGRVTVKSDGTVSDAASARVSVAGGAAGGHGGELEISAATTPQLQLQLDGSAAPGFQRGRLTIDPATIRIDDSGSGSISSGTVSAGDAPSTLVLPTSAFNNFSVIDLQATSLIDIRSLWTLPDAPSGGASLTLESKGDIVFSQSSGIIAGSGWKVSLFAGSTFDGLGGVTAGTGSIKGRTSAVNGYSLSTIDGGLSLTAGKDIAVLNSTVSTTSGDVSLRSTGGSISGNSFSLASSSGNLSVGAANNVTLANGQISSRASGGIQVTADTGNITATGAVLSTEKGNIDLAANGNISFPKAQTGGVRTMGGGSITATATTGSITTGGNNNGYEIPDANEDLAVSSELGGFSTAAGGNVTLNAGKDVTSYLPVSADIANGRIDAGTGAFGFGFDSNEKPIRGNVSITAGGSVYGHFVIADGIGQITAKQGNAGTTQQQLALTTRTGAWTVEARDIALQEVRNAQGVFNRSGGGVAANSRYHLFDYAVGTPDLKPSDIHYIAPTSVTLKAGNSIDLVGANLPRNREEVNALPTIYPPVLSMETGPGGIIFGNPTSGSLTTTILFPSPLGNLSILSGTGGIQGLGPAGSSLTLSDSGSQRWTGVNSFIISDHQSGVPVHYKDSTSATIDVAGGVDNMTFNLGKAAHISIGKDLTQSSVFWQNNNPDDKSSLTVGGRIFNRSNYTFIPLLSDEPDPDLTLVDQSCTILNLDVRYDVVSRTVIVRGRVSPPAAGQNDPLKNLMINGVDSAGQPACVKPTTPFLTDRVIDELYKQSADITSAPQLGYQVAGPGSLTVTARSMDLGISKGIVSQGPLSNPTLANTSLLGADLSVKTTDGDLNMFSSAIVSLAGGKVSVDSRGKIVAGSDLVLPSSEGTRGIYSTSGSDVTVRAKGDIDINGSRIATYDGGTVSVTSETGNVDAGSGGLAFQKVQQVKVDPVTRKVITKSDYIPGSGILAATFATGTAKVGDIVLYTPQGDIIARSGGIVQAPFNGVDGSKATVTVTAGSEGYLGNIDATGSGIIGGTIHLKATGDIRGVVFASGSADFFTPQNASLTLISQGPVTGSSGTLTGTLISFSSISVDAGSINASLQANSVSTGGSQNTSTTGFAAGNAATATATAASADSGKKNAGTKPEATAEDGDAAKRNSKPMLAQTRARVTVLLPGKAN